jgi:hypothetical protein
MVLARFLAATGYRPVALAVQRPIKSLLLLSNNVGARKERLPTLTPAGAVCARKTCAWPPRAAVAIPTSPGRADTCERANIFHFSPRNRDSTCRSARANATHGSEGDKLVREGGCATACRQAVDFQCCSHGPGRTVPTPDGLTACEQTVPHGPVPEGHEVLAGDEVPGYRARPVWRHRPACRRSRGRGKGPPSAPLLSRLTEWRAFLRE